MQNICFVLCLWFIFVSLIIKSTVMNARLTEGNLIVNKGFAEHDAIQSKIAKLNHSLGLRSILSGAWTYDKLAHNGAKVLNISFSDAYRLGFDELVKYI